MTLNQVKKRVIAIAKNHAQINTVFWGSYDEFLQNGDVVYPALFCELQDEISIDSEQKQTFYNVRFWVLDLLNLATETEENEFEIYSDLLTVAEDLQTLFSNNKFDDWDISKTNNASFGKYQLQDITAGVDFKVQISVNYNQNRCSVPLKSNDEINTPIPPYMPIIKNFVATVTGSSIGATEIQNNELRMRDILMVYLGDKLLVKSSTITSPNEYNYNMALGIVRFGVELQEEQVIQILHNNIL